MSTKEIKPGVTITSPDPRLPVLLKKFRDNWPWVLLVLIIVLWLTRIPQNFIWWSKIPGTAFEKETYVSKVYVLVFPSKNSSKNYRLKAVVSREKDCSFYQWCELDYYVARVNWPNGGYTNFYDGYSDGCMVFPNEPIDFYFSLDPCKATNGDKRNYYIQLTKEVVR